MAKAKLEARPKSRRLSRDFRLAVDVGNTQTVLGLFEGDRVLKHWRVATRKDVTVDEIALWLRGLVLPSVSRSEVRCAIASVVPAQDGPWRAALAEVFGGASRTMPRVLDHRDCRGLALDVEIPSQIGADRLANVLGAHAIGISTGIVVDFGTATTFDVFTRDAYHGGAICPGLQSGMRALAQNAARLSEAELRWPETAVGRTTEEALRIGVLRGAVGMVEHLIREISIERKMKNPVVLATGGLSHRIKGHSPGIHRFEPDLTLIGINHLLSGPDPKKTATAKKTPKRTASKPRTAATGRKRA